MAAAGDRHAQRAQTAGIRGKNSANEGAAYCVRPQAGYTYPALDNSYNIMQIVALHSPHSYLRALTACPVMRGACD